MSRAGPVSNYKRGAPHAMVVVLTDPTIRSWGKFEEPNPENRESSLVASKTGQITKSFVWAEWDKGWLRLRRHKKQEVIWIPKPLSWEASIMQERRGVWNRPAATGYS